MRLIVHICGRIQGGIGVGGKSLRVRTGLVVLLDLFCPRCHGCSSGEDRQQSTQRGRGAIATAELYAHPGREVIRGGDIALQSPAYNSRSPLRLGLAIEGLSPVGKPLESPQWRSFGSEILR